MTAPALRCELRHAPGLYCPEDATHLVSRVDASRDYWYVCATHALARTRQYAAEASPLDGTRVPLRLVLDWWPPKHRRVNRAAAARVTA